MSTTDQNPKKRGANAALGLIAMVAGIVLLGVGSAGVLQGINSNSLDSTMRAALALGAVSLLAGVVLFGSASRPQRPNFCLHCGEINEYGASACAVCHSPMAS